MSYMGLSIIKLNMRKPQVHNLNNDPTRKKHLKKGTDAIQIM